MSASLWLAIFTTLLFSLPALAIPRFAARNGMECIQCHVNPTGGGMRNEYGRNVFENTFLPWSAKHAPKSWIAEPFSDADADKAASSTGFSPDVTEWLSLGADARAAYIYIRPDLVSESSGQREITSSFFLMQADLYHAAKINEYITLYVDVGVYTGFEAWGLLRLTQPEAPLTLYTKVGRFLPPFGIREVEHQLFTREGIGLGGTDRDTGIELDLFWGPLSLNAALLNGTLGDTAFDTTGSTRRSFEKAISTRTALRATPLGFRLQLGGSFYWSDNNLQPNPLLASGVPEGSNSEVQKGAIEMRGGAFVTINRGRLTYLGEAVAVQNRFASNAVPTLTGYATYQELSLVLTQGLELIGTYEFMDRDIGILNNSTHRAGIVLELFPLPFTELRAMVRRTFGEGIANPKWDAVLFLHLFM